MGSENYSGKLRCRLGVRPSPCLLEIYSPNHSPIAQLAEYLTVNQSVPGSSPGGGVIGINNKSYTDNNGKNRNTNLC